MEQFNLATGVWGEFIIEMVILCLTGITASATVLLRKNILDSITTFLRITRHGKDNPTLQEVMRDVRIHDILADLRNNCKSDRSYIFQFSNGTVFTTRNQMWKLSRTHESVSTGIRPCIGDLNGLISSSVHELLLPLWESDISNRAGIIKVSPEACDCNGKEKCAFPHGVYLFKVEDMNEGYTKGLLLSQAVVYMLMTPLLDLDFNRIGFVGLDFCWPEARVLDIRQNAEAICKTASIISYELKKKI